MVVLMESTLAADAAWVGYVRELVEHAETAGLGSRVFPVALERSALSIGIEEQALRWDLWAGTPVELHTVFDFTQPLRLRKVVCKLQDRVASAAISIIS